jgi:hypothetical protein
LGTLLASNITAADNDCWSPSLGIEQSLMIGQPAMIKQFACDRTKIA